MSLDNLTPAEFFRWFSLGQAVRRGAVKEATMYSYNGVVLPKLPNSDLQYAFIGVSAVYPDTRFYLWFGNTPITTNSLGQMNDGTILLGGITAQYMHTVGTETWGEVGEYPATSVTPIWSNYDILDMDGVVALASSTPIPVYE